MGGRNITCGYSTLLTQVEYLAGYERVRSAAQSSVSRNAGKELAVTVKYKSFLLVAAVIALGTNAIAQSPAQSPSHADHSFSGAEKWARVFDDPDRDAWQKPHEVISALKLAPDAAVADIGAGTGYFAVRFAHMLSRGHVYGIDVEPDMVKYLAERAKKERLSNLTAVAGAAGDPRIPAPVDLVILVDVYHHLHARDDYFRKLRASLKPGGRVAVIDFRMDTAAGPPKSARIAPDRVKAEMKSAGYALAEEHAFLPNQYFLVFTPAAPPASTDLRAVAPVVAATGTGPGQAGYVHFFLIGAPDGEWETGVGIELPDQRIAWSFPELGVVVSPFIDTGVLQAKRKLYEVQYLYGVRPFPDEEAMRVLRTELEARIVPWAEAETPYCIIRGPSDPICLSCLGFVLRILFPEPAPPYAARARDFDQAALRSVYTTDDLLLFLAGLHGIHSKDARLKRVNELSLPDNMREEIVRLVHASAPGNLNETAAPTPAASATKPRPAPKPVARPSQHRTPQPVKS